MREHGTKTTVVFLPADGEASWSLLRSSVSLLSGGTAQPENTYFRILNVASQVRERLDRVLNMPLVRNIQVDDKNHPKSSYYACEIYHRIN